MGEQIFTYMTGIFQAMPTYFYRGLVSVFCIVTVITSLFMGFKKGLRITTRLLLIEYVFFIICSTFFFRTYSVGRGHNFTLGWSYSAIKEGCYEMIIQNVMNVFAFVPIGILLLLTFRFIKWWQALLIGCGISITIEALQYFFHRGFAETDDVMHNTFGCFLGYILFKGSRCMVKGLRLWF